MFKIFNSSYCESTGQSGLALPSRAGGGDEQPAQLYQCPPAESGLTCTWLNFWNGPSDVFLSLFLNNYIIKNNLLKAWAQQWITMRYNTQSLPKSKFFQTANLPGAFFSGSRCVTATQTSQQSLAEKAEVINIDKTWVSFSIYNSEMVSHSLRWSDRYRWREFNSSKITIFFHNFNWIVIINGLKILAGVTSFDDFDLMD